LTLARALTNLGSNLHYINDINGEYLSANIGIGTGLNLHLNEKNLLTLGLDINKLKIQVFWSKSIVFHI